MLRAFAFGAVSLLFLSPTIVRGQSATIDNLGWLTTTNPVSLAHAVSADGAVVAGGAGSSGSARSVVRWTSAAGLQDLGNLAPGVQYRFAAAYGCSADGNVLVGYSEISSSFTPRAIRVAGGMQSLGSLAGSSDADESWANACSADGNVVVGETDVDPTYARAFRWQNNVMTSLGTIGGVTGDSEANDCSADGTVAVGRSFNGSRSHACRFVVGFPVLDLGTIGGFDGNSFARAVTPNGQLIVGSSQATGGVEHAMSWTQWTGMQDLGNVDGATGNSAAYAVSADGKMIGGFSPNASRPGGAAAVWIDGQPRQLYDLLTKDYKLQLPGWTRLDTVNGVSDDGRTLVGWGIWSGATAAFRVKLSPNSPPVVDITGPTSVECDGGTTRVTLSARIVDADLADRLTVKWYVGGVERKAQTGVAGGADVTFTYDYPDGASFVQCNAHDGKALGYDQTSVTVVDTTSPIVIVAPDVTRKVDKGKKYATIKLKKPQVTDVCDPSPTVTNNAPNRFPIGVTRVRWTVTDDAGNVATAIQKVTVVNAAPRANAGADVATSTSKRMAPIALDGSISDDADGHKLSYRWSAPGATIADPKAAKTTGQFPIGRTEVRLTVTDSAGERSTDRIVVDVSKLRSARAAAAIADASLYEAYVIADASFYDPEAGGDSIASAGLQSASYAKFLGILAGDELDASAVTNDELTEYAALRYGQAQFASQAGAELLDSYLTHGDLNAFVASMYAYSASSYGLADLASNERVDLVVARADERRP